MRSLSLFLLMIAACQREPAPPTTPPPSPAAAAPAPAAATPATPIAANAAYESQQWARCAELFAALAAGGTGKPVDNYYNAACCHARGGNADAAFAMLDRSIATGLRDDAHLARDTDLASLHGDARWTKTLAAVKAARDAEESKVGDPALRRELLALVAEDQAARQALIAAKGPPDKAVQDRVAAADRTSTTRMKEVVAKHGWPGKRLVGEEGANAAWLLVQHADLDRDFQKLCLPLLEKAVAAGDAEPRHYAYLHDRVAVAESRPQRFGTQYRDGKPAPIEDEARVDERRRQVGLGTMAEYDQQMRARYGDKLNAKPDTKPNAN
jgi:hypothetical protein